MMSTNYGITPSGSSSTQVDAAQMNTFRSYVTILGDPNAKDELKLKATQELSEHFEEITQCSGYQSFLEHSMKIFIKILQDGEPNFISEFSVQQVRNSLLYFYILIILIKFFFYLDSKISPRNDS